MTLKLILTGMKIKVKNSGVVKLQLYKDAKRGNLAIIEAMKNVPFAIKRAYLIHKLSKKIKVRGEHAHKKLTQAMFCVSGSCTLHLDDGQNRQSVRMTDSTHGIILGRGLWHSMTDFSDDCAILIVADDYYKESDYIRDYQKFLKYAKR